MHVPVSGHVWSGSSATPHAPLVPPGAQGVTVPSTGPIVSPSSQADGFMGLTHERSYLDSEGLPPNEIATIQSAWVPTTRGLYDLKWKLFQV